MRYILAIVTGLLMLISVNVNAQETLTSPGSSVSSPIYPRQRFIIIGTSAATNNTFRLDTECGSVDLMVSKQILGHPTASVWTATPVPDAPCVIDGRVHYQLYASGQGDQVLLINTDTKVTWRFDLASMSWIHMWFFIRAAFIFKLNAI